MNKQFKLLICGSRSFYNFELLKKEVDLFLSGLDETCDLVKEQDLPQIVIISGTARGADQLGEKYAQLYKYPVEKYRPEWENWGKRAGYIRNEIMVTICDACIAFWDQKSKGTLHTINLCKKYGKRLKVVKY